MTSVGDQRQLVVGTWRLRSFERRDTAGGLLAHLFGEAPLGYLTYTESGHFHLNVMRRGRERFRGTTPESGTNAERAAAFSSSLSYAGTWTISTEPGTSVMTHHVEISSFPNWTDLNLRRAFTVTTRELVLIASEGLPRGERVVVRWDREKPAR
jgi:hypothetical protein